MQRDGAIDVHANWPSCQTNSSWIFGSPIFIKLEGTMSKGLAQLNRSRARNFVCPYISKCRRMFTPDDTASMAIQFY